MRRALKNARRISPALFSRFTMLRDSDKGTKPTWLGPLLAALLMPVSLTAATVLASAETNVDVRCRIQAEENNGWFRVSGIAIADERVAGHYQFHVAKRSASGSSNNVQSGRFSLEAGRETAVTSVYLDLGARNAYSAELILDWDKGTRKCTAP